jgi:hypothetical protein
LSLGIAVVIGINYVRDLIKELRTQEQVSATLAQQYKQVGNNAVASNAQAPQAQVTTQAESAFGTVLLAYMQSQGAQINSLTTAMGQLNLQVNNLKPNALPTQYQPTQQNTSTGALTGYPMEEARTPPRSSVNLFYDPKQIDPNKAFAGTSWTSYQENFKTSVGDWVKIPSGGFKTSVAMKRTISKPDPNHPGQMVEVGSEDIPITGANTVFSPQGIEAGITQPVPRFTGSFGVSNSKANGYGISGSLDYRLTDRYGIYVGTANNGVMGGVSVRFDIPKK